MRRISTRQFQFNASKEIAKGLPVELTRHGKTVAYVTDINPEKTARSEASSIDVLNKSVQSLTFTVGTLKAQTYDHFPQKLIACETHHVYKQTCGCV